MHQPDGKNSIIIVGGANKCCWPETLSDEDQEIVRNARIVLLQSEIPDSVNIQVAKLSQAVVKCHKMGVKQVLVKLGANGFALFVEGEESIKQPAISAAAVLDTTGAGDTFTSSFAVALVEGKS
ncbi:Ribokinase [Quillaja saponaria]|uniref:Ribokinase n=1 Tax=Quillaja saponaria TaxID=32244 RepID=A0AAD7QIC4_QUISA|nr:Ribokinase [Quillaja saponaria]